MAPTKNTRAVPKQVTTMLPLARKGLVKRAQNIQENVEPVATRGKRKADNSPLKNDKIKRSALGNLTNNVNTLHLEDDTKQMAKDKIANTKRKENIFATSHTTNVNLPREEQQNGTLVARQTKIATRATTRNLITAKVPDENRSIPTFSNTLHVQLQPPTHVKIKEELLEVSVVQQQKSQKPPVRRISNEFNKTEESLYMSALEDISSSESLRLSGNFQEARRRSALLQSEKTKMKTEASTSSSDLSVTVTPPTIIAQIPADVEDFDKANWNDPFQVSCYTMDIFNYLREREAEFPIMDYMPKQVHLSKWMRSLLVDWMVEVQETFELNHETLYLAVKIVDLFLCKVVINKEKLQLLGAAALFISCKFDERTPPFIEDFLYICDGAYKHDELIKMEMTTLKTIDYDLGIPLSYRFLRRYARCAKVPMSTLTLARYILELSLMDYATISLSDSKLAAATLFMALRMHGEIHAWSSTLEYYSGYKLEEFADYVPLLNAGLHRKPKGTIKTIKSKYSHKIFQEAAKVPLMTTEKLFEYTDLLSPSIQIHDEKKKTNQ